MIKTLFRMEPVSERQLEEERQRRERAAPPQRLVFSAPQGLAGAASAPGTAPGTLGAGGGPPGRPGPPPAPQPIRVEEKTGRNDPCPCGSGKKYKKCHGATAGGAG